MEMLRKADKDLDFTIKDLYTKNKLTRNNKSATLLFLVKTVSFGHISPIAMEPLFPKYRCPNFKY